MQVSLYFGDKLIDEVDRVAKRDGRSRSKVIQALVESGLRAAESGGIEELSGAWKDDRSAEEIVRDVCGDRRKPRRPSK